MVLYLRFVKPVFQGQDNWRVAEVRQERGRTSTLVLEADNHPGMRFLPGQFAWVKLRGVPFTLEEHPFSFSSSAEEPRRVEFGIKALGDFSASIAGVRPGTPAYLDGPHGAFTIDRYPAPGYVLIAGGVGITPVISILKTMADRKDPRPLLLIYAQKRWEDVTYREELEALKQRLDLTIAYAVADAPEGLGVGGRIDQALLARVLPKELIARHYFLCGPPPMMEAVEAALGALDVPRARIQSERFNLA